MMILSPVYNVTFSNSLPRLQFIDPRLRAETHRPRIFKGVFAGK